MAGSDEVHQALGRHIVRIRTVRSLAAPQKRIASQQLQYLEMRLDLRRAKIDGAAELLLPKWRGQDRFPSVELLSLSRAMRPPAHLVLYSLRQAAITVSRLSFGALNYPHKYKGCFA